MSSSKIRLNSKASLEALLQILAEESVSKAYSDRETAGSIEQLRQDRLAHDLARLRKSGKKKLPDVHQEEDDAVSDDAPKKKQSKEAPQQDTHSESEPSDQKQEITYTMIKDRVNSIRSGRSLRDKEIRDELKDYFSSLSDDEQSALYAFLDGIAQVLTAGLEGEDADQPSKDPHNIEMSKSKDKPKDDKETKTVAHKKKVSRPSSGQTPGAEDISPPIDVGSKQRTEAVRKRIRELMG